MNFFVFAYYSYKDPVFQSAVLPYFLTNKNRGRVVLLTWEQSQFAMNENELSSVKAELKANNIVWYRAKWNSGSFKLLKKAYDFLYGMFVSVYLINKYKTDVIYSEGFPGAIFGHYLSLSTGKKHVVHTFEPHADYMLDSTVWTKASWEYKFLKWVEPKIANRASAIVTATQVYKQILVDKGINTSILVKPSCIDTDFYVYNAEQRMHIRQRLGINNNQIAICYLGKLGGMYMDEEIFQFFSQCHIIDSHKFYFMLFTNSPQAEIDRLSEKYKIPKDKLFSKYLAKQEVPDYLSAADLGFCGIKPIPSRRYSSPIKNGEYWSCSLPSIIPVGISDDYEQVQKYSAGYVFESNADYSNIILNIINDFNDKYKVESLRVNARKLALEKRSLRNANSTFNRIQSVVHAK